MIVITDLLTALDRAAEAYYTTRTAEAQEQYYEAGVRLKAAIDAQHAALHRCVGALEALRPNKQHNSLCAWVLDEGPCDCDFGARNRIIDKAKAAIEAVG